MHVAGELDDHPPTLDLQQRYTSLSTTQTGFPTGAKRSSAPRRDRPRLPTHPQNGERTLRPSALAVPNPPSTTCPPSLSCHGITTGAIIALVLLPRPERFRAEHRLPSTESGGYPPPSFEDVGDVLNDPVIPTANHKAVDVFQRERAPQAHRPGRHAVPLDPKSWIELAAVARPLQLMLSCNGAVDNRPSPPTFSPVSSPQHCATAASTSFISSAPIPYLQRGAREPPSTNHQGLGCV
jgi:hypothetical protein